MNIFLYKTGRNLNRSIRACHSFGIKTLNLVECDGSYLKGNLFSAEVNLLNNVFPPNKGTLIVEKNGVSKLSKIDWSKVENIVIGGENVTIPVKYGMYSARIETKNNLCLTTEAALNIVLYEAMVSRLQRIKNFRRIDAYVMASGMPKTSDIIFLSNHFSIQRIIDLTKRERNLLKQTCSKNSIEYIKIPIDENEPSIETVLYASELLAQNKKTLVFCYRGIHRTGAVLYHYKGIRLKTEQFKNHQKLLLLCQNSNNFAYAHTCKPA